MTLFVSAVGTGTLAAYSLSILWRGEWKYHELIAPTVLWVLGSLGLLTAAAIVVRGRKPFGGAVRVTVLLWLATGIMVASLFYGVLDNCRISCGSNIEGKVKSPTGAWTAVQFSTKCFARTRLCPSSSYIAIVGQMGQTGDEETVFKTVPDTYMELRWKSDHVLLIQYWAVPDVHVLRREARIGEVEVEYLPTGPM